LVEKLNYPYLSIMKKFLIALVLILTVGISCKKERGLCACSPIKPPLLNLVIKNAGGDDLLNETNTGSFTKNQIKLYYKDSNGLDKDIRFDIRGPFTYGTNNTKFNYNQLFSDEIVTLANLGYVVFYLKLGNNTPYELKLVIDQDKMVDKLQIDNTEALKEASIMKYYFSGTVFYLVK
jgi:hypothetical protein